MAGSHLTQDGLSSPRRALLTFGGLCSAALTNLCKARSDSLRLLTDADDRHGMALGEANHGDAESHVVRLCGLASELRARRCSDRTICWFVAGCGSGGAVTWFTFLPSFIFILAGLAPLVRIDPMATCASHGAAYASQQRSSCDPHLAVFFAYHVCGPRGLAGRISTG